MLWWAGHCFYQNFWLIHYRLVHTWSQLSATVLARFAGGLVAKLVSGPHSHLSLLSPMITWLLELFTRDNCARPWEVENTRVSSVSMAPGSEDRCFHHSTVRILLLLRIRHSSKVEWLRKQRRRFFLGQANVAAKTQARPISKFNNIISVWRSGVLFQVCRISCAYIKYSYKQLHLQCIVGGDLIAMWFTLLASHCASPTVIAKVECLSILAIGLALVAAAIVNWCTLSQALQTSQRKRYCWQLRLVWTRL